ncbi:MAG: bacteriohemerythrin [Campylobacteraceae bacterium]|jgi:hemerythrin|nr:bacteriohemerythrin [Campylobacteraceae bacterium]
MAYWDWDLSYGVGVAEIDKQHRKLVQYINELHDSCVRNDRNVVKNTLAGLTDYIVAHCSFEEELMKRARYPMFAQHKSEHDAFASSINKYKTTFNSGGDIAGQLMAELQIWLTHHAVQGGAMYRDCMQKIFIEEKNSTRQSWLQNIFSFL